MKLKAAYIEEEFTVHVLVPRVGRVALWQVSPHFLVLHCGAVKLVRVELLVPRHVHCPQLRIAEHQFLPA